MAFDAVTYAAAVSASGGGGGSDVPGGEPGKLLVADEDGNLSWQREIELFNINAVSPRPVTTIGPQNISQTLDSDNSHSEAHFNTMNIGLEMEWIQNDQTTSTAMGVSSDSFSLERNESDETHTILEKECDISTENVYLYTNRFDEDHSTEAMLGLDSDDSSSAYTLMLNQKIGTDNDTVVLSPTNITYTHETGAGSVEETKSWTELLSGGGGDNKLYHHKIMVNAGGTNSYTLYEINNRAEAFTSFNDLYDYYGFSKVYTGQVIHDSDFYMLACGFWGTTHTSLFGKLIPLRQTDNTITGITFNRFVQDVVTEL